MMSTNKRNINADKLTRYGQHLEMVPEFKYFSVWIDNYTWKTHIKHLEMKCKK